MNSTTRRRQNWVLDPVQDLLFIIAAPLLSLGATLWLMQRHGASEGAALVIVAHVVLTVAHHMPTFLRIYGDVELFRRFKWSFALAPVLPLLFSAAVLTWLYVQQFPVEYFLYLYIFLALWDPWHFLRQHFGFMRIYDRHNAAPAGLASNMDWALCVIWFVYIMIASADWIPRMLEDMYRSAHLPLMQYFSITALDAAQQFMAWLALGMSLVYGGYLLWCWRRGYYLSHAKLALLLCTFGVMYLTYTPNDWILALAPAWSFKVGFATVGIVHMTQYLAIVWRYDQRIAQHSRARAGWFTWLHDRKTSLGIAVAALAYVLFCVGYGHAITTTHEGRLAMSVFLAIGFTSTLMHYYFDGFIWKVRHEQNRAALDLATTHAPDRGQSWWHNSTVQSPLQVASRQCLYFGLPMLILTLGALSVWHSDRTPYLKYMLEAQQSSQQGDAVQAADAARKAYRRMSSELPTLRKIAELRPTAAHQAELAFLIYNQSMYEQLLMPQLAGKQPTAAQMSAHQTNVREAAQWLLSAAYLGGDLGHPGRENLSREQAREVAASWQRQLSN